MERLLPALCFARGGRIETKSMALLDDLEASFDPRSSRSCQVDLRAKQVGDAKVFVKWRLPWAPTESGFHLWCIGGCVESRWRPCRGTNGAPGGTEREVIAWLSSGTNSSAYLSCAYEASAQLTLDLVASYGTSVDEVMRLEVFENERRTSVGDVWSNRWWPLVRLWGEDSSDQPPTLDAILKSIDAFSSATRERRVEAALQFAARSSAFEYPIRRHPDWERMLATTLSELSDDELAYVAEGSPGALVRATEDWGRL